MQLLIDTHVALWWAEDPDRLAPEARSAITDNRNTVHFSVASAWELALKARSGKLQLDVERFVTQLTAEGLGLLGIGLSHTLVAGSLDWEHRDPFDRMLVAQSRDHDFLMVSRDQKILHFLGDLALRA